MAWPCAPSRGPGYVGPVWVNNGFPPGHHGPYLASRRSRVTRESAGQVMAASTFAGKGQELESLSPARHPDAGAMQDAGRPAAHAEVGEQ